MISSTAAAPLELIFPIYGLLTCSSTQHDIDQAAFYKNKGAIIMAMYTHYVFPGVIELMQLLHKTGAIKLSFSYEARRGDDGEKREPTTIDINAATIFVKKLLLLSLGKEEYGKIKNNISILSQQQLEKAIYKQEPVENRMVITTDPYFGKIKKELFYLKPTDNNSFANLTAKDSRYQKIYNEEGYKLPKCTVIDLDTGVSGMSEISDKTPSVEDPVTPEESEAISGASVTSVSEASDELLILASSQKVEKVEKGKEILILKTKEALFLGYLDLKTEKYREVEITNQKLKTLPSGPIEDKKTIMQILALVAQYGGKTKKLLLISNRIYYLTGLLFTVLEKSLSTNTSFAETLFELQKSKAHILKEKDELYLFGLKKLQLMNPKLAFTTPTSYSKDAQWDPSQNTKEEEKDLNEALLSEVYNSDCVIL